MVRSTGMAPGKLKTVGYLISSLSVLLLGTASWSGLEGKPLLRFCLVAGMIASVAGMVCRWLTYQKDHKGNGAPPAA